MFVFSRSVCFFFHYPATPEIYTYLHTLSLHDALPISLCQLHSSPEVQRLGLPKLQMKRSSQGRESEIELALAEVMAKATASGPSLAAISFSRRAISSSARSEEHTSELQSLMRISYAVFCLKKKNTIQVLKSTHSSRITHLCEN